MNFKDIYISKKERFSIGIEKTLNKYYISIPVSNGFVDYEEYYEIDSSIFEKYPHNIDEIKTLVHEYKDQKRDEDLIIKPGKNRGTAA